MSRKKKFKFLKFCHLLSLPQHSEDPTTNFKTTNSHNFFVKFQQVLSFFIYSNWSKNRENARLFNFGIGCFNKRY